MKKMIIIDDDPAILDSIGLVFSEESYHVVVYPNAEYILSGNFDVPDIFIIDKQLSGVDGLDICKYLRRHPDTKDTPILIMSASPSVSHMAVLAGASAFIEKPYTMKELRSMVEKYTS